MLYQKKKKPGASQVIHDLSYPQSRSVNSLIPPDITVVSYEDFDHVSNLIVQAEPSAFTAKVDVQSAFRILMIHPSDRHILGFSWRGHYFMDNCFPMGCSISCMLFETFSHAVQSALLTFYSFLFMSHILDDFIFIGPDNSLNCHRQLEHFRCIARFIGMPKNSSKTKLCVVPIHGIEVDASIM